MSVYFHEQVIKAGAAEDLLIQPRFAVHLLWLLEIILDPILRPLGDKLKDMSLNSFELHL